MKPILIREWLSLLASCLVCAGATPSPGALPQVVRLDGDWDFTYSPSLNNGQPDLPQPKAFTCTMPVPGYWDDHLSRLQMAPFWSGARFNNSRRIDFPMGDSPPDIAMPYLLGVGYYRKFVDVPAEWNERTVTLELKGARIESWVFLNGRVLGHYFSQSVPHDVPLNPALKPGERNELIIVVANNHARRNGCDTRSWSGLAAGIHQPVSLKITGGARIADLYVRSHTADPKLSWEVELEGRTDNTTLNWAVRDPDSGTLLGQGVTLASAGKIQWASETFGMQPWSDQHPKLYELQIGLLRDGQIIDQRVQRYGLRRIERDRTGLRLNGRPILLRGGTEHYSFVNNKLCTAPADPESYRDIIRKLQQLGFNWLRCHTWVPSEEYMQAADELGLMFQVEPTPGFDPAEWVNILRHCRRHPSVVLYCCGNEENLDEEKIGFLERMASLQRQHAPDALFSPQEALRGIEYYYDISNLGEDFVREPYPHNPRRLEKIKAFSDVLASYAWGFLSYDSVTADWRVLDQRYAAYERPILSHEIGILGNYLNLDLEHRYKGIRLGEEMYGSLRRNLEREGLLEKAPTYYRHSCAWNQALRKHNVEMARKSKYTAGYDILGAIDYHWHRAGYPSGILNEFYELKPGDSIPNVLEYNAESVLLLDHTNHRNLTAGQPCEFDLMTSLFTPAPIEAGTVRWRLADDRGFVHQRGQWSVRAVPNGVVSKLGTVRFNAPATTAAAKLTLFTHLSSDAIELHNDWNYWVFPSSPPPPFNATADRAVLEKFPGRYAGLRPAAPQAPADRAQAIAKLHVVSTLDEATLGALARGASIVLLGAGPFPVLPTSFQMAICGRPNGNLATVLADHPILSRFPHEGWCDWQFYGMLQGGNAVNFSQLPVPFEPVIEVVSSFKNILKQASLFESRVGDGRLLVCTLNLKLADPAAVWMLDRILEYAASPAFQPLHTMEPAAMRRLFGANFQPTSSETDRALDPNATPARKE